MFSKVSSSNSSSKPWNFGMPLPYGGPPNIRMRQEDLNKCPRDGEGTLDNPLVIWAARLTSDQRRELAVPEFEHEEDLYRAIDANADMAKTAAIRAGCTVAWIICPVHASKYVYDRDGQKIAIKWDRNGNPLQYRVAVADPHLTVKLGTSEDWCHLHGHINVVVDKRGFPTDFMKSSQRLQEGHLTNNDNRTMELFEWGNKGNEEQQRFEQEAADYEVFKTRTLSRRQDWEIEDDNDDNDYEDDIEIPDYNPMAYGNREDPTGLSPDYEEYLVKKWNPYREHGHSISMKEFGYSTRRFRNNYNPPPRRQRSHHYRSYR